MQGDEIFTAAEKAKLFGESQCPTCRYNVNYCACKSPPLHPSIQTFLALLDEAKSLALRKAADYGLDDDPDRNLKNGQDFGLPNWVTISCRMDDKMSRIKTAARQRLTTGQVHLQNEGLRDAFLDLAIYSLKAVVRIDEEGI